MYYNRVRRAALCLQRSYRGYATRAKVQQEMERRNKAAIMIQAVYRCHMCYTQFTRVRHAAITLQSHFRRIRAQKEYNHIRNNAIFMQQKWRATLLARSMHADFEAKRKAALTIQRYFRGYQCMKETRCQFVCLHTASVILQRSIRQYLSRRRQQKQAGATCIQRAFRHYRRIAEMKVI